MTGRQTRRPTEQGLETGWKWVLRLMGIAGFVYLLVTDPDVSAYFYVLLGGLLGLPTAIDRQIKANRERGGGGGDDRR